MVYNNKNGTPTEEESFAILDVAYEGGMTVLDTADDFRDEFANVDPFIISPWL